MRSIPVMPFCRKPIQWISSRKRESRTTALSHNTMWKAAMRRLFHATFICRCRRRWCDGQTSIAERRGKSGYTVASTNCRASFTVRCAVRSTAGLPGTTVASTPLSGGAALAWSMARQRVTHRPSRRAICRTRWLRQFMRCWAKRTLSSQSWK